MRPPETEPGQAPSRRAESGCTDAEPQAESQRVICAIPARFDSHRLPGKVLLALDGKPMIRHVFERAAAAKGVAEVVVLTDDQRVQEAVESFGGRCQMTPRDCRSGTDRIAFAAREWQADAVINVQGDEPLLAPADVELLAGHLASNPREEMVTLATPATADDLRDPDTVKVVRDRDGRALYFSRAPIPWPGTSETPPAEHIGLRHVGLYGYRRHTLLRLAKLEPTPLERRESLEQLRALENGIAIRVLVTEHSGIGVDNQGDLERAERMLRAQRGEARLSKARLSEDRSAETQMNQLPTHPKHANPLKTGEIQRRV